VLDAELRDGSLTEPRAVAAINMLNARLLIESPISGNSSFMVSWRRSFIDRIIGELHPVEDERGRRDTLRTGYYFYDWSAKLSFRPTQRSHLSFSYYKGRDVLDLRLPFDLSRDFSSWLRPADLFFEVGQNWSNRLYNVRYQYLYSSRFFLTMTAYDSSYEAAEGTLVQPTTTASVMSSYDIQLRDLGLKVDADYFASLSHNVRAGLQAVNRTFQSGLDAIVQHTPALVDSQAQRSNIEAVELVAYLQDTWKPSPRWQIQPGLRLSYFGSGRFTRLSPRLSVQYAVHPRNLVFRAAVGTQVQYIQRLRDRFSFLYDLVSSRWVPASSLVDPSWSLQVTAGAESRLRPWLVLDAGVYWRGARRVLLPRDEFQQKEGIDGPGIEVGTLLGQYTLGREKAYGLELGARIERGKWTALVSYTGSRAFNRAPDLGEDRFRPARYDVPRVLQGVVRRAGARWTYGLSSIFRSGYPLTVPEGRYALGSPLEKEPVLYLFRPQVNNGRLPPYLRIDVTAEYTFTLLSARWQAQLALYNVINRRNVVGRIYDPAPTFVRTDDRLGLPLLPLLELKMTL
jgi:hypothetical protein